MKRPKLIWRLAPFYIAIAVLIGVYFWHAYQNNAKAQKQLEKDSRQAVAQLAKNPSVIHKISGKPVRLVIPRIGTDVKVQDGYYVASQHAWTVSSDTANYATNTSPINNKTGKTLIYGHWFNNVLGKTRDLKPNDIAYIYTDNGHIFKYRYEDKTVIQPTDIWIFNNLGGKPGLKLMTCEGTWAQHRRLMSFKLEKAV